MFVLCASQQAKTNRLKKKAQRNEAEQETHTHQHTHIHTDSPGTVDIEIYLHNSGFSVCGFRLLRLFQFLVSLFASCCFFCFISFFSSTFATLSASTKGHRLKQINSTLRKERKCVWERAEESAGSAGKQ